MGVLHARFSTGSDSVYVQVVYIPGFSPVDTNMKNLGGGGVQQEVTQHQNETITLTFQESSLPFFLLRWTWFKGSIYKIKISATK
jgi:hypothetical protein